MSFIGEPSADSQPENGQGGDERKDGKNRWNGVAWFFFLIVFTHHKSRRLPSRGGGGRRRKWLAFIQLHSRFWQTLVASGQWHGGRASGDGAGSERDGWRWLRNGIRGASSRSEGDGWRGCRRPRSPSWRGRGRRRGRRRSARSGTRVLGIGLESDAHGFFFQRNCGSLFHWRLRVVIILIAHILAVCRNLRMTNNHPFNH